MVPVWQHNYSGTLLQRLTLSQDLTARVDAGGPGWQPRADGHGHGRQLLQQCGLPTAAAGGQPALCGRLDTLMLAACRLQHMPFGLCISHAGGSAKCWLSVQQQ